MDTNDVLKKEKKKKVLNEKGRVEQISNIHLVILMCIFLRHAQTRVCHKGFSQADTGF